MTQMVLFQFFHVFNSRSLDRSIFQLSPFSNRFLFVSIVAALLAQMALLYLEPMQMLFRTVPLSAADWGLLALVGSTVIIGGEIDKYLNRHRHEYLG
jgi:magnesium-transporting ATPase (P-type)